MATVNKNLSDYNPDTIPNGASMHIAIAVAEWNENITGNLLAAAKQTLLDNGVLESNIYVRWIPGTFELPLAAQFFLENKSVDAVICLGCVIQGDTKHFDFVCEGATHGVLQVGLKYNKPVIFGVLTDNTLQQSIDRSGGIHGNKGVDSALAALKMVALQRDLLPR